MPDGAYPFVGFPMGKFAYCAFAPILCTSSFGGKSDKESDVDREGLSIFPNVFQQQNSLLTIKLPGAGSIKHHGGISALLSKQLQLPACEVSLP